MPESISFDFRNRILVILEVAVVLVNRHIFVHMDLQLIDLATTMSLTLLDLAISVIANFAPTCSLFFRGILSLFLILIFLHLHL